MNWIVEEGIGEHRALRLRNGAITAARVEWPGQLAAGLVADARLVSRAAGSPRGTVRFDSGEEALVDRLPASASEGARLRVEVTRSAIGEAGRRKLAQARPTEAECRPAPTLAERLRDEGHMVRVATRPDADGWDELWAEAATGALPFPGGELVCTPTPAMTLIDIDGTLPPRALALAAVPAIAAAFDRLDLAGSIGIDFPTLSEKADRKAVDAALAQALAHRPAERTAINGFGFVQVVTRLERPSLLHRIAMDRAGAAARLLARRAERVAGPGALLLTAPPAMHAAFPAEWEADLARRTGRTIHWREDPGLAWHGGFAQAVAS